MRIIIVTGLSGAGKSTALRALEDIGFYCVDNLPLPMALDFIDLMEADPQIDDVAMAVDARQHQYLSGYLEPIKRLRDRNHKVEVLFLEAPDQVLLRRFSETRRRHPLSGDDLVDGIRRDREILVGLRHAAAVVDTGALNVHQLKGIIQERYTKGGGQLAVTLLSFGYKHGLPPEADLAFDVRFLPNPYFDPDLSGRDGRDQEVSTFVLQSAEAIELLGHLEKLLRFSLPHYEAEGKLYLTIAVGCTGGRHRSVAMVEELRRRLGGDWDLQVRHRDLERKA
jgi:RNase adapter protein RapZ